MAVCEVCGNDYDKAFRVTTAHGDTRTSDSFECAIHALAPVCKRCGVRIVGHGIEQGGVIFCCAQGEGATRHLDGVDACAGRRWEVGGASPLR